MIVVDNVGNVKFAAPVAPESIRPCIDNIDVAVCWNEAKDLLENYLGHDIRNDKDARKARNLYFTDVATRQGNNIVATRHELNTSVMGAAARLAFGIND
jgi:hypothetical protein|nr:MAG TPA: hypothetical protein [Caudoviricetes sp.]